MVSGLRSLSSRTHTNNNNRWEGEELSFLFSFVVQQLYKKLDVKAQKSPFTSESSARALAVFRGQIPTRRRVVVRCPLKRLDLSPRLGFPRGRRLRRYTRATNTSTTQTVSFSHHHCALAQLNQKTKTTIETKGKRLLFSSR